MKNLSEEEVIRGTIESVADEVKAPAVPIAVSGNGRLSLKDGTLGAVGKLAVDAGYWQLAPSVTPRLSVA